MIWVRVDAVLERHCELICVVFFWQCGFGDVRGVFDRDVENSQPKNDMRTFWVHTKLIKKFVFCF